MHLIVAPGHRSPRGAPSARRDLHRLSSRTSPDWAACRCADAALVASPFKSAYVSAKHGLAGLTKTVALELAEHGVTANAICPGYVLTPLVQKQIPEQAKARGISEEAVMKDVLLAAQPTKQFVEVSQIAALTTFLCPDEAASITGALLPIDGGWTAH